MSELAVWAARSVMCLRERRPADPSVSVGGLSEVFDHPCFVEGGDAARARIGFESARSRFEDERAFPFDNYFGEPIGGWVRGDCLDLGCFTGGRAVAWLERYEPRSMSGVDVRRDFIRAAVGFARARGVDVGFRVGRGECLPWRDGAFDTILSFDVFEHVQSVRRTLGECWRVLRPGGRLLTVFPGYFQPVEHHLSLVTGVPGLQYLFSGGTLIEAQARVMRSRGSGADWYRRDRMEWWERGSSINGMTFRRFRGLIREQGWRVLSNPCLPIGRVGRRAQAGRGRFVASVAGPLARVPGLRELALHRVVFVLQKPAVRELMAGG